MQNISIEDAPLAVQEEFFMLRRFIESMGRQVERYTVAELARLLRKRAKSSANVSDYIDFVAFMRSEIAEMRSTGHSGTAQSYAAALNRLVEFEGHDAKDVNTLTAAWLVNFESWLKKQPVVHQSAEAKKSSPRYLTSTGIAVYMRCIRATLNRMKLQFNDEDRGIMPIIVNPFARYRVPRERVAYKRAITQEQIRAIANHVPKNKIEELSADMFMLSFMLRGMNLVDLYTCTDYHDGRIDYRRTKTASRHDEVYSVAVPEEAVDLVRRYGDRTGKRVFDFYNRYATNDNFVKKVNAGLKTIGQAVGIEGLTHYAARHSFATIAANECGFSLDRVGAALNHVVDKRQAVTERYIKRDNSGVDEVQRAVLDVTL
ncbi:MAG: site-specific integrase [Tidjanibacter sp.]|nr:site-specific integrase [Tidjanibacter sp.]